MSIGKSVTLTIFIIVVILAASIFTSVDFRHAEITEMKGNRVLYHIEYDMACIDNACQIYNETITRP